MLSQEIQDKAHVEALDVNEPLGHYQGFDSCVSAKFHELSPIHGYLLSKGRTIENYYKYCPADSPLKQLFEGLFYGTRGVEFGPGKREGSIPPYLSPRAIGILAGSLDRCLRKEEAFSTGSVKELLLNDPGVRELHRSACEEYQRKEEIAASALTEFQHLKVHINTLNKKDKDLGNEISKLNARVNSIRDNALNTNPELKARAQELKEEAKEQKQIRIDKNDTPQTRKEKVALNSAIVSKRDALLREREELIDLTIQGQSDEFVELQTELTSLREKRFGVEAEIVQARERTYEKIRTTWEDTEAGAAFADANLPIKRASRYLDDFISSYLTSHDPREALKEPLNNLLQSLKTLAEANHTGILTGYPAELPVYALQYLLSWKISSPTDIEQFLDGVATTFDEAILSTSRLQESNTFESLVETKEAERIYGRHTPPIAYTKFANISHNGETINFPDCGETSLRNFLNLFLFNTDTQRFDHHRLIESGLNFHPSVIEFYKNHPEVDSLTSQHVHDAWAEVVSTAARQSDQQNEVRFTLPAQKPICELCPGVSNSMRALNALTGANDFRSITEALLPYADYIREINLEYFDPEGDDLEDFTNTVIIEYDRVRIEWHFLQRHYRFYEKTKTAAGHTIADIPESMDRLSSVVPATSLLSLYSGNLVKLPLSEIQQSEWFLHLTQEEQFFCIMSTRNDWMEDLRGIGHFGVLHTETHRNQGLRKFYEQAILAIPDTHGYQEWRNDMAQFIRINEARAFFQTAEVLQDGTTT